MMIAAIIVRCEFALRIAGASEFTSPDHKRVLEQVALLEILDQCRSRLVCVVALPANRRGKSLELHRAGDLAALLPLPWPSVAAIPLARISGVSRRRVARMPPSLFSDAWEAP